MYEINNSIAGRLIIELPDCQIRFSQLHNKIEVFKFDWNTEKFVFKKDFVNFVEAFDYTKSLTGE